ncbi:MAG: hypothetical protein K9M02_17015 [Thiohalocapsa sp.]|nr:hypothetical protein [Thiohalocapsa sp.]
MSKGTALRLPVVALSAEYLVIGHLMRRNVLAYKAPPNNEGYDLICIHPDPRQAAGQVRVQVKSRYQTDCDRGFPVKERTFDAFDFLVIAFLNIGWFYSNKPVLEGYADPEFYTLPVNFIREHHRKSASGWEKVLTNGLDLSAYRNERGFEQIAEVLGAAYPSR